MDVLKKRMETLVIASPGTVRYTVISRRICPDFDPEQCRCIVDKPFCHSRDPIHGLCPYLWPERN
jgi:hypothetical protein